MIYNLCKKSHCSACVHDEQWFRWGRVCPVKNADGRDGTDVTCIETVFQTRIMPSRTVVLLYSCDVM